MNTPPLFKQPEFILLFKQGDERAFSMIFNHHYPPLCFFAVRMTQDKEAAQDIVCDSLTRLWERKSGFDNAQAIKAFLYISTRNACINFLKQKKLHGRYHDDWIHTRDIKQEAIDHEIIRAETVAGIHEAMQELPSACRNIFELMYVEGLTPRETGIRLNISVNTVRNQHVRGLRKLQQSRLDYFSMS